MRGCPQGSMMGGMVVETLRICPLAVVGEREYDCTIYIYLSSTATYRNTRHLILQNEPIKAHVSCTWFANISVDMSPRQNKD